MSEVLISNDNAVRTITLNRPDKRNALNEALVAALKAVLREADADGSLRAVVIKGAGKDFCSGADLAALQKIAESSYEENLEDARSLAELFLLIRKLKVPVIALSSSAATSRIFELALASPSPILMITFSMRGIAIGFLMSNSFASAGAISFLYLSFSLAIV